MFRPNYRAIFRLNFEEVEFTVDNAFNLRDLLLQNLVKIIVVYYIENLNLNFKFIIYILYYILAYIQLMIGYDMIYLTAIGLTPGGSSTAHIYTKTINRTTQNKQYIEQHKNFGRVRAVPRLGELYPSICLTTEEKAWKNLSQGSRTIRIHRLNNKNEINYSIKQEYNHIDKK